MNCILKAPKLIAKVKPNSLLCEINLSFKYISVRENKAWSVLFEKNCGKLIEFGANFGILRLDLYFRSKDYDSSQSIFLLLALEKNSDWGLVRPT